jgi:hypothetical protein
MATLTDQAGVLAGAQVSTAAGSTGKQPVIVSRAADREPCRQRFTRRFGDFKWNRATGLLLDHRCALAQDAAGRDVADPQLDEIATTKLGVDSAVEERQVANPVAGFELLTDAPYVLRFQRRLRADDPPTIPRAL